MHPQHELDRRAPDDVRRQLAAQLRLDNSHLEAIPIEGLYRLREQLTIDDLTGVLGRRAGIAALLETIVLVRRFRSAELIVAFLDVDGLKRINDTRGHAAGDRSLIAVAEAVTSVLRRNDIVFRYGGDEFVCALPFVSIELACRRMLEAWEIANRFGLSFSAGFAELRPEDDLASLLARADDCLYAGRRHTGRRAWRVAG
jgi:diguanylate cyclase (GGDEF)-like protein